MSGATVNVNANHSEEVVAQLSTEDRDASELLFHDQRVDLAHVAAFVLRLDIFNDQVPRALLVVRHAYPGVVGDHSLVQRQNGLITHFQPSNLDYYMLITLAIHQLRRVYQTDGSDGSEKATIL